MSPARKPPARPRGRPLTVAVVGIKGGPGKSTVATILLHGWHAAGISVVGVDTDSKAQTLTRWKAMGAADLDKPPIFFAGRNLKRDFGKATARYAVAVIDTPSSEKAEPGALEDSLALADLVIVPCAPSGPELWTIPDLLEAVAVAAKKRKRPIDVLGVVTKRVTVSVIGRDFDRELSKRGIDVAKSQLHLRMDYVEAISVGEVPPTYAAGDQSATESSLLAHEVGKRLGLKFGGKRVRK